jgi:hypothetical protein
MPQARTQEERDIERRCKAWAFKIAQKDCYVIFHKLPSHTLGKCYPDQDGEATFWRLREFGMRSWKRNVIVIDLEKNKRGGYDIEDLIIHECLHLKIPDHSNKFAAEMKKWIGRYEWGKDTSGNNVRRDEPA